MTLCFIRIHSGGTSEKAETAVRQLIKSPDQVGAILLGRRRARKVSQTDLAAALGISQERLSRLEANAAGLTLERLIALANLLDLELVLQDKADEPGSDTEW